MRQLVAAVVLSLLALSASADCVCSDTISGTADFDNFSTTTGTLPSSCTNGTWGVGIDMTSAGSSAFPQGALVSWLRSGYTGDRTTSGGYFINTAASSAKSVYLGSTDTNRLANAAVLGFSVSYSQGLNAGGVFIGDQSGGGIGGRAAGAVGECYANGPCAGLVGFSNSGGPRNGVVATLMPDPPAGPAALLAESGTSGLPSILARQNGVNVFVVPFGGQAQLQDPGTTKPTCNAQSAGSWWYTKAPIGVGVADTLEFCKKDSLDFYHWVLQP